MSLNAEKNTESYKDNNESFRHDYNLTVLFCIIISVALTINYLLPNDYLALLCTAVAIVKLFICKEKDLLPLMIYFPFLAYLFRFQNYNIFIFVCLAFIARASLLKKENLVFTIVGIPIYFAIHLFSSINTDFSIGDLIPLFCIMILMYACILYDESRKDACIYFFITGHIVTSFLGLARDIYISAGWYNDSFRFSGLSYDPNFYAITAVITLCILMLGLGYKIKTVRWFIVTIITISFGVITYSKSFLFCLIAIILISFFTAEHKVRSNILKTLPAILIICFIFRKQLFGVYESFKARFVAVDSLDSLTTGRVRLWKIYWADIFKSVESVLVGNGVVQSIKSAAHNTYLEMLQKFGFIGAASDIFFLYACNGKIKSRFKLSINAAFVILIFAALLFFLSAYTFYGFWQCIFIIMILSRRDEQSAETISNYSGV